MLLQVLDEGMPVPGANVSISQIPLSNSSVHARAIADGVDATLNFSLTPQMLEDSAVVPGLAWRSFHPKVSFQSIPGKALLAQFQAGHSSRAL